MDNPQIPEPIIFEWDEHNQTKIRLKHNIIAQEAEEVFFHDKKVKFDQTHSTAEQRYQLVGISNSLRILFVVFTIRGKRIRIISARIANKKERITYGQKT